MPAKPSTVVAEISSEVCSRVVSGDRVGAGAIDEIVGLHFGDALNCGQSVLVKDPAP